MTTVYRVCEGTYSPSVLQVKATLLWEEMLPLSRARPYKLAVIWMGSEETKPLPPIPFLDYHGSYAVYCVSPGTEGSSLADN